MDKVNEPVEDIDLNDEEIDCGDSCKIVYSDNVGGQEDD